ncbi:hypothetical protein LSH36_128g02062 [Paralvinella palmiformis]|uniref:Gamma-secretase subunit Aph-1 n=1 Tax=Paralvinella palmiformis TaxID=53620 RepID=A0AAD9N8E2_9ANNE|nr:hypothetical protein LSH36_128g02062 [Paralvinella palmiformis]
MTNNAHVIVHALSPVIHELMLVFLKSAFFWLVSLLLSSLWWFAVVPLREQLAFGLVFSVIFQEAFRLVFYVLIRKAEIGLKRVWREEAGGSTSALVNNKSLIAYVSGFGFGVISGAFSLVNVLADMTGPGTIGLHGNPQNFFITSAVLTLCFILLHTCWGVVFFNGLEKKRYYQVVIVLLSHMLISCLGRNGLHCEHLARPAEWWKWFNFGPLFPYTVSVRVRANQLASVACCYPSDFGRRGGILADGEAFWPTIY